MDNMQQSESRGMTARISIQEIAPDSTKRCGVKNCGGEVERRIILMGPGQATIWNNLVNLLLRPPGIKLDLDRAFTGKNFWGFYACMMHDKRLAGTINNLL
jgi:hypothetical protein